MTPRDASKPAPVAVPAMAFGLLERLWNPLADLDLDFSDDDQLD